MSAGIKSISELFLSILLFWSTLGMFEDVLLFRFCCGVIRLQCSAISLNSLLLFNNSDGVSFITDLMYFKFLWIFS